jgi:hypothetical protein
MLTGRPSVTSNGYPMVRYVNGIWDSTSPISSITFDLVIGSGTWGGSGSTATYFSVLGSTT